MVLAIVSHPLRLNIEGPASGVLVSLVKKDLVQGRVIRQ